MTRAAVPPGGPATITGVLYQALVALTRCVTLSSLSVEQDDATGGVTSATLILEPRTGGDHEVQRSGTRVVEQIKQRSIGRWSLRELIAEVLPDLYHAVDPDRVTTYRFVTNAAMGDWHSAYEFFRSLKDRNAVDFVTALDTSREIRFDHRSTSQSGFWERTCYTEKSLFDRIVEHLRSVPSIKDESIDSIRRKTWTLLGNLDLELGADFGVCEEVVNTWLAQRIDAIEDVAKIRSALMADLLQWASKGDAFVNPNELFRAHGLTATPLADWDGHVRRARDLLDRRAKAIGYDSRGDVRPKLAESAVARWRLARPVLVIAGESGQGKTWHALSLLSRLAAQNEVALFTEGSGDAERDVNALATVLWQDVFGHDNSLPLTRIRGRIAKVDPILAARPVFLCVDGVSDLREARRLVQVALENVSYRMAITCSLEIAEDLESDIPKECLERIDVPDFSLGELTRYLSRAVGDCWAEIPEDVRATLFRPLLAKLYCDLADGGSWRPTREYELYERCWSRLYMGEQREHPGDAERLAKAAYELLRGTTYPWTTSSLCGDPTHDSLVPRLVRAGWLRSRTPSTFEVWHDRLLNWAVAQGIVSELANKRISEPESISLVRDIHNGRSTLGDRLRYVPMDVLWLVTDPARNWTNLAVGLLESLEEGD